MQGLLCHTFAVVALAVAPLAADAVQQVPDSTDAAIAHLRTAVNSQRNGSHLPLLFALRQLKDPTLGPLFERLADHPDWQVQVHATLGLAEIDPSGQVHPERIGAIDLAAQEAVIASAIDLKMLNVERMKQVLAVDRIGDLPRLMLHAELTLLDDSLDGDAVRKLAEHDDLRISGLASLLLAEAGDAAAFASFQSRYATAAPRMQRLVLPWLLDAIRQYQLRSASAWLRGLYRDQLVSDRDKQFIVLSAVAADPSGNLDLWHSYLGSSPSYAQRVRAGFMLLGAGENAPPEAYDELRGQEDDALINHLASAGKAVAMGDDASQPMIDLIELRHPRTTEWVMSTLRDQQGPTAQRVYQHILESAANAEAGQSGRPEQVGLAVTAAARLFAIDPQWVTAKLLHPETDDVLQQAILLGMFESDSPSAGEAAKNVTTVGVGRQASLRTLLIAKHAQSLSEDELRHLGRIAGGGGRVSDVLRAQAAWLYLKHAGEIDTAMEQLFASADY